MNIHKLADEINLLDIAAITFIVLAASILQFVLKELPCPLCLLQRVGLLTISIGFAMNLRLGIKPSHYAISILAAIFTAAVSLRQVLLHILPNSEPYGRLVFGISLYGWVFIIAVCFIIGIPFTQLFDKQFKRRNNNDSKLLRGVTSIVFFLLFLVVALNIVTTYLQCGLKQCPDNPKTYKLIHSQQVSEILHGRNVEVVV